MSDIRFYDFDFNLLYILPPFGRGKGYKAINTQQDLNSSGTFTIVFKDNDLKDIAKENRGGLIIDWNGFQGFLTSYHFEDATCQLSGLHLNGLLHREVIMARNEETNSVDYFANKAIQSIGWLTNEEVTNATSVTYGTDKPQTADEYLQNLFDIGRCGYEIKADFVSKKYLFKNIVRNKNPLMLSKANLNAYNIKTTYIGKEIAHGGWYKLEDEWVYISESSNSGIHKIDTVLSATTAIEAKKELRQRKAEFEIVASTQKLVYGRDYKLGDVIRLQEDGITQEKVVSGINMWNENGYGENPILTEA